jgi:hypothetical protein
LITIIVVFILVNKQNSKLFCHPVFSDCDKIPVINDLKDPRFMLVYEFRSFRTLSLSSVVSGLVMRQHAKMGDHMVKES